MTSQMILIFYYSESIRSFSILIFTNSFQLFDDGATAATKKCPLFAYFFY